MSVLSLFAEHQKLFSRAVRSLQLKAPTGDGTNASVEPTLHYLNWASGLVEVTE